MAVPLVDGKFNTTEWEGYYASGDGVLYPGGGGQDYDVEYLGLYIKDVLVEHFASFPVNDLDLFPGQMSDVNIVQVKGGEGLPLKVRFYTLPAVAIETQSAKRFEGIHLFGVVCMIDHNMVVEDGYGQLTQLPNNIPAANRNKRTPNLRVTFLLHTL